MKRANSEISLHFFLAQDLVILYVTTQNGIINHAVEIN